MQSYRLNGFTSLDDLRLSNEPDPKPQRGEVLVRVHAVSLNYRDLAMILGRYPRPCKKGLIPTSDAAGEIIEVGEGVTAWRVGDRVVNAFHPRWFGGPIRPGAGAESYGDAQDGWLVERKAVSQEAIVRIPDHLSYEEAATLPCAGLTAWTALTGASPVRAGHSVLTLGTGGVSIFALQLARAFGATVFATTSSAAKTERLKQMGATAVVNYRDEPEWGKRIRELSGGGVDCAVEVGGPGTIHQSLRAVTPGGEIASIGFLAAANSGIDFFSLKLTSATFRNITVGNRTALEAMARAISAVKLKPIVDRVFPFAAAREAYAHLQSGTHFGKVVIHVA